MNNCEKYRKQLSLMLDGELTETQRAELEAHMADCRECARLYDAFAFISHTIDQGMAEPPESLSSDIMATIQSEGTRAPAVKKRARGWAGLTALAACLAVVIFAAAKSGNFDLNGASASTRTAAFDANVMEGSVESAPESIVADSRAAAESNTAVDSDSASGDAGENEGGAITPYSGAVEQDDLLVAYTETEESATDTEKQAHPAEHTQTATLMGVTAIAVYNGEPETPDAEPIMTVTDEDSLGIIMALLEMEEAGDDLEVTGSPIFILEVTNDDDSCYTLSVWIVDGRLCCVSDVDGILYVAAGDAGDLFAFIAAA